MTSNDRNVAPGANEPLPSVYCRVDRLIQLGRMAALVADVSRQVAVLPAQVAKLPGVKEEEIASIQRDLQNGFDGLQKALKNVLLGLAQ